jgi:hypothetical protein
MHLTVRGSNGSLSLVPEKPATYMHFIALGKENYPAGL